MNKYLVSSLKHRAHIKKPIQTPNDGGGFDRGYATVDSFWMGLKMESSYIRAVRGENTGEGITQIGIARFQALQYLGKAFSAGYSTGFNTIADINFIKSNYFIFIEENSSTRGRMFRIMGFARDEKNRQWISIQLQEIEEQGTGYKI